MSQNPLAFWCPSVVDLILQNLTVKEMLTLSETSKDFFDFIKNNRKFMREVAIKLKNAQNFKDEELKYFLVHAKRNYENLELDGDRMITRISLIVKYQKSAWKRVTISNMVFNRSAILQSFLDSIKSSAEELLMYSIFIFNCDAKLLIRFPELKRLVMYECNEQENTFFKKISFVVSGVTKLEEMRLVYCGLGEENQKKLLIDNPRLTALELSEVSDTFFNFFQTRKFFNLTDFKINFVIPEKVRAKPNLHSFLILQSPHLLHLEFNGWIYSDIIETIYKMKNIKSLKISGAKQCFKYIDSQRLTLDLTENSSLKELVLTDNLHDVPRIWQKLLKHLTNLDRFKMSNSSFISSYR